MAMDMDTEPKYDDHGFKGEEQDIRRPSSTNNEFSLAGDHQLKRGLKSRHIQFLALGMAPFTPTGITHFIH
jgi:amino acid permease